jgi:hypothetical protein
VSGLAVLPVFVRCLFQNKIKEDFLPCKSLKSRATREEIFKVINSYTIEHEISCGKCVNTCTDGASAMTGKTAGVVALSESWSRLVRIVTVCSIGKRLSPKQLNDLETVLDDAVKMVNYIK